MSSKEIKDKVAFCQKAVEAMRTESWSLMPEAEKVCEQIYSFVCEASDAQQQT